MRRRISKLIMGICTILLVSPICAETRIGVVTGQRWVDDVKVNNVTTGIEEDQSLSALLEWKYSAVADWQVYLSKLATNTKGLSASTDLDFTVAQIGGLRWLETGAFRPYVGATGGATQVDAQGDTATRFSLSLFAGLNWDIGEHVGIRTEARWIGTLLNSDTELLCANGLCRVSIDAGTWNQTEVAAALVARF